MENGPESLHQKRQEFLRQIKLAIALVQGHWDSESSNLLQNDLTLGEVEDADMSTGEKLAIKAILFAADTFMGDGSMSSILLGAPTTLPVRERGLIVLSEAVSISYEDWARSVVLHHSISHGGAFDKINSGFSRRLRGFRSVIVKKVGDIDGDFEKVGNLESVYEDREGMETRLYENLSSRIGAMKPDSLAALLENLKIETEDEILFSSLVAAREIFIEILRKRQEGVGSVLKSLGGDELQI